MADQPGRGSRRGLGRGLSVLLGEQEASAHGGSDLRHIPVAQISPHADQPRRTIDPAALDALATSIAEHGLMQPVVVRAIPGGFELIAGERRWRAAQQAGLTELPAVVREADDRARLELALVENVVREDLSPIEIANAVAVLVEDFGQSHQQVATHLGRSRPAVSNLLRLLELPEDVQAMLDRGELSEGHGRAVLMADGAKQRTRLAREAAAGGWSVRELERRARVAPPAAPAEPAAIDVGDTVTDRALDAFAAVFDVPVRVRPRAGGRYVVELRFEDEAALRTALGRLGGA